MNRLTWIYRLQQRMALTQRESWALLVVAGLLLIGQVVQRVSTDAVPIPDYAATDAAFAEALRQYTAQQTADSLATDTSASGSAPASAPEASSPAGFPLDLNTATAADLEQLPRIGPKLAARIVAYRSAQGGFRSVDELVNVSGIGQKTLAGLTPLLHIAPASASIRPN